MTNYFKSIGSKPTIKSDNIFTRDDAKPELLLDYLERSPQSIEKYCDEISNMYLKWYLELFSTFNIVVRGSQSKFELLETFREGYLSETDYYGNAVITIRLHGFTPISLQTFCNAVFETTGKKAASDDDITDFINNLDFICKTHYVFLIHEFEQFYSECKDICDIIFHIYQECPRFCHIIMSSSQINAGRIIQKLKVPNNLLFYYVSYGQSYFYERTHGALTNGLDGGQNMNHNFDLASLESVYGAMQKSCQNIMVYILQYHVEQSKPSSDKTPLEFDRLLEHCQMKFWVRRAQILRAHLGELTDHSIVKVEENKIDCLCDPGTCEKFLANIQT